jgi:hypothetical protein
MLEGLFSNGNWPRPPPRFGVPRYVPPTPDIAGFSERRIGQVVWCSTFVLPPPITERSFEALRCYLNPWKIKTPALASASESQSWHKLASFPAHCTILGDRIDIESLKFEPCTQSEQTSETSSEVSSSHKHHHDGQEARVQVSTAFAPNLVSLLTLSKRAQQERPRTRQTHSMLELLTVHPKRQGDQEIHNSQHGRISRHSYVSSRSPTFNSS